MNNWKRYLALAVALVLAVGGTTAVFATDLEASGEASTLLQRGPEVRIDLPVTTQGTFWPPATFVDENGDYILIGMLLVEDEFGNVFPITKQAAIVSKDTVPPLDAEGREDFSNPFVPYDVVRHLDLSPGSPDLDLVLNTNSFGPAIGDFGGGPRIPSIHDSQYNHNGFSRNGQNCLDLFPDSLQATNFMRPSFPLHKNPIPGFMGDGVAYDVVTGEPFVPRLLAGVGCPPQGCEGEDPLHTRREEPITLGEWLEGSVELRIQLVDLDPEQGAYTAAEFEVHGKKLLPNSIYSMVLGRSALFVPNPVPILPHVAATTAHMITDDRGYGVMRFKLENPFPDPAVDFGGLRVGGLGLILHSDHTLWGLCPYRFGPGVEAHPIVFSGSEGDLELVPWITVAKSATSAASAN